MMSVVVGPLLSPNSSDEVNQQELAEAEQHAFLLADNNGSGGY